MLRVFYIAILFLSFKAKAQDGKFTFKLATAARTSAGVYSADSVLVRTLWNDVKYPAGTYSKYWDGKDDKGVPLVSPDEKYTVKVISNNVKYEWEGTIGNSSDSTSGLTKHRGYYHCMRGLAFSGDYGYFCTGYSEGSPSLAKFKINTPNQKKQFFTSTTQSGDINFVAADDKNVYWGVFDAYAPNNSFVFATKISDDTETEFSNSSSYTITHGKTYKQAISLVKRPRSRISGLAVQKKGNYLFVAREETNELQVLNKTTGALVRAISIPLPRSIAVDTEENLWMISGTGNASKYTVNADGSLTDPILALPNLVDPVAIDISPDGKKIAVADGGTSQQVKFFSTKNGDLLTTLGEAGGYFTDARVTDNKFYFNDVQGKKQTFVAFEPNGSYWVSDPGNFRVQHYDAKNKFFNRIMSLGATYSTCVDKNNIKRVWADYLEFEMDYSVLPTGHSGWKLVRNWGANISAAYDRSEKFRFILTLSNGRTYGFIGTKSGKEILEFPAKGQLRFTGMVPRLGRSYTMAQDGSIEQYIRANVGGVSLLNKYKLTGFDKDGNPTWSNLPITLYTTPFLSAMDPNAQPKSECVTSTGKVINFDYNVVQTYVNGVPKVWAKGYHLGAIQMGSNKWLWKTEQATTLNYKGDYPGAGYFDIGNGVHNNAGGTVCIVDRNVITSYHGEFWKNGQTNKFNHYLDNGLAIAQFGITRAETTDHATPGMAGNVLTPILVKGPAGNLYLIHGDESDHAGVHRWKISGLNTIAEQNIPIKYPTPVIQKKADPSDLMAGLKYDVILANNDGSGWFRQPENEITVNQYKNIFSVMTNILSYDRLSSPDLYIRFAKEGTNTYTVSHELGKDPVSKSWKLTGLIAYPHNMPNGRSISQFFEVLDADGKILTSFYCNMNWQSRPLTATIFGNNKVIAEGSDVLIKKSMAPFTSIEISVINNVVSFTYGKYKTIKTTVQDLSANWKQPATLRCRFESTENPAIYGAIIGMKDLKFIRDF